MSVERITYFAYNDGVDPSRLPLGTLSFDYANPRTARRSYVPDTSITSSFKEAGLIDEDERSFCSMLWSQNHDALLDIDVKKVIGMGHKSSKADVRLIVGAPGSKVEIKDADKLFEKYLLNHESVMDWFRTRLSVAKSLTATVKNVVAAPSIWLLTGTYMIDDGVVYSIRKEESSNKASAAMPITEPTGLVGLAGLKVGAVARIADGIEAQASTQIKGKKVWAAQWIKVRARYVAQSHLAAKPNAIVKTLQLQDVWSTGTTRFAEVPAVELELSNEREEHSVAESDVFDTAWWNKFDDTLEEHLEDLKGED